MIELPGIRTFYQYRIITVHYIHTTVYYISLFSSVTRDDNCIVDKSEKE